MEDAIGNRCPDTDASVPLIHTRRGQGYVLGAAVKPIDLTKVGVEWEHDVNERVGQRFRVLARLDVLWSVR